MSKNNHIYTKSSKNLIETIKISIKRKSVEKEVSESPRVKSPPIMMDTEEIFDLIPVFSPSSSNSLGAEEWIETIEDIKMIYGWDDRLTLVYASLRLKDAAKLWFKENLCEWPEFKIKFVRRFSNRISKTEYFEQLLNRRKEYNESFENYVYDVERTAIKCGCSVESTINYIISGLRDSSLRSQLIACNCKSVDALMSCIKTFTAVHKKNDDLRNRLGRSSNVLGKKATEEHTSTQKVCYKCRKLGHYSSDCWSKNALVDEREKPRLEPASKESVIKRGVMCVKCKKFGHYASDCYFNEVFCHNCKRKGHKSYDCRIKVDKELCEERRDQRISENLSHDDKINSKVSVKYELERRHINEFNLNSKNCFFNEAFCHNCKRKDHKSNDCPFQLDKELCEERSDQRNSENYRRRITRTRSEDFCTKCKIEGHHTKDCNFNANGFSNDVFCNDCKQIGHKSYDCRLRVRKELHKENRGERNSEQFRFDTKINSKGCCAKCNKEGYHTRDCNLNSKACYSNDVFCHNCQLKGHKSYDCPLKIDTKIREEWRDDQDSKNFSQDNLIKKCKTEGHQTTDSHANDMLYNESGHISKDYPINPKVLQKFRNEKRNERTIFCRKCRVKGHYTKDCKFEKLIRDGDEELKTDIGATKKTCYNCRKIGHYAANCTFLNKKIDRCIESASNEPPAKKLCVPEKQIEQKCLECGLPGHLAFECQLKTLVSTKTSSIDRLSTSFKFNRNLSELLKPVRIDNVYVTALVNLASDCTTLQKSEFEKHNWKIQPCNLELNSFGPGSSRTIGKIYKNVCVGEVELKIDILVVDDSIQDFPLVLGSNFLDHPSVCVVKKYRSLEIKLIDSKSEIAPAQVPGIEEQLQIKTEPGLDVEENNLLELLDMIKQDYA